MAGRRFDVADVVEVLQHWQTGRSGRHLARSLGMGRDRVRQIVAAAEAAGLSPGGPPLGRQEWQERVPALFAARLSPSFTEQRQQLERFHEAIASRLETNTAQTVWQRLCDEDGLEVSIRTFRRYVAECIQDGVPVEKTTVRREVPSAGKVAEVDYGRMGLWEDPIAQRRRVVQGFLMALPTSRHLFVDPVFVCDQRSWVASHVAAFEFFGAVPEVIRLDNLKTGVLSADIYDPQLNRAYAEMAEHFGVLLDPCRAGKPKDKPHVERSVPYARDSYWRGRSFGSQIQMRDGAQHWCIEVAGARPHRGLPGTVFDVFRRVERPAMRPLPQDKFEIAKWATAKLHPDCHLQVGGRFFSAPYRHIGKRLDVRLGERLVTIYDRGTLIKTHLLRRGQRRYTDPADLPEQKVAFLMRTPA
jgi:transposase